MLRRVFDYNGLTSIGFESTKILLERIAENLEFEIPQDSAIDCSIKINQAKHPVEIVKDKRFDYLTINREEKDGITSIKYTRYNTPVRTIHQRSTSEYIVDTNIAFDESAGMICIRNHLSNHPYIIKRPLLHASLVEMEGQGVLIPGDFREGKTTLTTYLLQERGAIFISDENVVLDSLNTKLCGLYVPRTIRVRFKTIAELGLAKVLDDVSLARSTQYIDDDAIERIINSRSFEVEAGLAFSRKRFCDLLGTSSRENTPISLVIFPKYNPHTNKAFVRTLPKKEGIYHLSMNGLAKKSDIDPKQLGKFQLTLNEEYFEGIEFLELNFSGFESLVNGGIKL